MALTPGSIELTQPDWLWLLAVLAILGLLWRRGARQVDDDGLAFDSPYANTRVLHPLLSLLNRDTRAVSVGYRLRSLFTGLALCLFVLALTQPVRIGEKLPDSPQQRNIVFIVDTSLSMALRDYVLDEQRIDRMSLLKGVLDRFVQALRGNRVSVIVFGESAYTFVPLTHDLDLVRRQLSRIETTMAGRYEAVGDAVALAVNEASAQPDQRRILVLFTDMHRSTGTIDPRTAAALAAEAHLPLYTIAIGATTYAAEEQRITGLIYEPVNLPLLNEMAERTGARGYQAGDADALRQAIADIDRREKTSVTQPPRYYREPLYQWPLLLGLLLLTGGQCLRIFSRT